MSRVCLEVSPSKLGSLLGIRNMYRYARPAPRHGTPCGMFVRSKPLLLTGLKAVLLLQRPGTQEASSPVKDALDWEHPRESVDAIDKRLQRLRDAAELRQSYDLQIEQREARHAAYASTEDEWPYQPIHHPEGKFPYYKGPRYIAPHYVGSPIKP